MKLQDVIDFMYHFASDRVTLEVTTASGCRKTICLEKEIDEGLGVTFDRDVFDGIRVCRNKCAFCFVSQLPSGVRPSLRVRDDDYRLSFLHGNFITMTNMTLKDFRRIAELKLSPLYISVHTMNPELRARMLGNDRGAEIQNQLEWLAKMGIRFHCQIVVIPGVNGGTELESTVQKLYDMRPWAQSVGVVPVGLTKYHKGGLRGLSPEEAKEIVQLVEKYQKRSRAAGFTGWVYASDEIYLLAGIPVPQFEEYDDFPQLENGIGMVASLLESVSRAREELSRFPADPPKSILMCGKLAHPILEEALGPLSKAGGGFLEIRPVTNEFLGESVTVSGLLAGRDIAEAALCTLRNGGREEPPLVVVPVQAAPYGVFLDDTTMDWLQERLQTTVLAAGPNADDLVKALKGVVRS